MKLNDIEKMINKQWFQIPNKFKNIELNEFQIMPNHVHGIIVLKNVIGTNAVVESIVGASFMKPNELMKPYIKSKNKIKIAKTNQHMGLINQTPTTITVGHIVRYFKAKCTYKLHNKGDNQIIWQRNYHDRIIRNAQELNKIREYIQNNPLTWEQDKNNPINIKLQ